MPQTMSVPATMLVLLVLYYVNIPCAVATSVLKMSLPDIAKQAKYIFYGQVIANEVKNDPDNHTVATYTTFKILNSIKGNLGATYAIKQLGGQLPGSQQRVIAYGIPSFKLNHEYVIFLPEKSRIGFSSPIGLGQGSYTVYRDQGIAKIQINFVEQIHKAVPATPSQQPNSGKVNNMPLKIFIDKIHQWIKPK